MHLQGGGKDEQIGNQYNQEGKHDTETCHRVENQLTDTFIGAREGHDCWDIAEEVVDHIGPTEVEPGNVSSVDGGIQETTEVGAYRHAGTHACCHGGVIT